MRTTRLLLLGSSVIAVIALFGLGTASATVLCKTATDPCTGGIYGEGTVIEASLKAETKSHLTGPLNLNSDCSQATMKAKVTNPGSKSSDVFGTVTSFSFGTCTYLTTELKAGSFSISSPTGGNGTFTWNEFETTLNRAPFPCIYSGPVALSLIGGEKASIGGKEVKIARTGHHVFCGTFGLWDIEYTVTSPGPLYVAAS